MRLSKKQRWTFYVIVIVGFIVGGWYLTATERPDAYTPRDAGEDAPYAAPDKTDPLAGDPSDEPDEPDESDETEETDEPDESDETDEPDEPDESDETDEPDESKGADEPESPERSDPDDD